VDGSEAKWRGYNLEYLAFLRIYKNHKESYFMTYPDKLIERDQVPLTEFVPSIAKWALRELL
jgi:hypothetical protein